MWQLAEAKNKFSEVFRKALSDGPQYITRRGARAVLVSADEWEEAAARPKRKPLGQYLIEGPSLEGLDLERDRSEGREVDFS